MITIIKSKSTLLKSYLFLFYMEDLLVMHEFTAQTLW